MRKLDENKLAKLHTAGELLDNKYGEAGTESRTVFHEKSIAWYYGEILRDRRKQLKITQQELYCPCRKGRNRYSDFKFLPYCPCLRHRVHTYIFIIH